MDAKQITQALCTCFSAVIFCLFLLQCVSWVVFRQFGLRGPSLREMFTPFPEKKRAFLPRPSEPTRKQEPDKCSRYPPVQRQ